MSNKDDKKTTPSFPEPFEFLNEELIPHIQRFHELEELRKAYNGNVTKQTDLKPAFTPPAYGIGSPSNNPSKNSSRIDAELQKVDAHLKQRIEGLITELNLDEDLSMQLRETLLERKYPNPFENKSPKEIEWLRTNSKDIETSAQFLLDQRRRVREMDKVDLSDRKNANEKIVNQATADKYIQTVKTNFMKSLSYTKAKETPVEKIHDFSKNKDLIIEKE